MPTWRRATVTAVMLMLSVPGFLSLPAAAQPPGQPPSANVTHMRTDDAVVLAVWSTCPEPVAEETHCLETQVQANTGRDGESIFFQQFSFVLHPEGNADLLGFSSWSGPVEVAVATDLSSATVEGPLEGFHCVPLEDWEVDCTEVGPSSFEAHWTATGPLERVADRSTPAPGAGRQDPLFVARTRYELRDATALATLGDAAVAGDVLFGQLARIKGQETLVCRGGPAMQEFCSWGP